MATSEFLKKLGEHWQSVSNSTANVYYTSTSSAIPQYINNIERQQREMEQEQQEYIWRQLYRTPFMRADMNPPSTAIAKPANTLNLIKKSIKEIKADAVSSEAQGRIQKKIDRLLDAGALAQAKILDMELRLRQKLHALSEWDYKVLPAEEIGRFENEHRMTATKDGLKVHIDPLEKYIGNPESGEAKDRIIPDKALDELEKAKERKLFDSYSVLWAEKVPDPLLLGCIDGCKDFFLITEWGEDVKFDDIMKGK